MRIAVDAQSLQGKVTGIGVATRNLFEALALEAPDIKFIFYHKKNKRDLRVPERIFWESVEIPFRLAKDKPDLVYSPGFAPPLMTSTHRVVTVNDLIGLTYPQNQKGFSKWYWSSWLPMALKKAECLVAISESTRQDIFRFLRIPEKRVRLIRLSANPSFKKLENGGKIQKLLSKYQIRPPFLISVSTLEPRKNLLKLLEAYNSLPSSGKDGFSLVLAGKPGSAAKELAAFVREKNLSESVKLLGYCSDEELVLLYNAAMGYVMVSLYEGFGLPALEAMSCGISGIVSNNSSLPEVVGDTALKIDPQSVDQIAEALNQYVAHDSMRQQLCLAAHERSKEFSVEKTAQSMARIFKEEVSRK